MNLDERYIEGKRFIDAALAELQQKYGMALRAVIRTEAVTSSFHQSRTELHLEPVAAWREGGDDDGEDESD